MYIFNTKSAAIKWANSYGWSYAYTVDPLEDGRWVVNWAFNEPYGC